MENKANEMICFGSWAINQPRAPKPSMIQKRLPYRLRRQIKIATAKDGITANMKRVKTIFSTPISAPFDEATSLLNRPTDPDRELVVFGSEDGVFKVDVKGWC